MNTCFTDEAFEFYECLAADNSKTYWNANKRVYDSAVRDPMRAILESLAETFDGEPMLFRPHRDVRFSNDKSPYKTHQGGFLQLAPALGYWMSIDAEGVRVGGGFRAQDRVQTARFRAAVHADSSGSELAAITARLIKSGYELGGDKVKTRPRGVAVDHARLDLLRHESLTAGRQVPHAQSTSSAFLKTLTVDWNRVRPLVEWCMAYAGPSS